MERKERKSKKTGARKVRNWEAVNAHFRSGAGAMGGGKKQTSKKNRSKSNQKNKDIITKQSWRYEDE